MVSSPNRFFANVSTRYTIRNGLCFFALAKSSDPIAVAAIAHVAPVAAAIASSVLKDPAAVVTAALPEACEIAARQ